MHDSLFGAASRFIAYLSNKAMPQLRRGARGEGRMAMHDCVLLSGLLVLCTPTNPKELTNAPDEFAAPQAPSICD